MTLPIKTDRSERLPPVLKAEVRNWKENKPLIVVFNKDREHFDHDVLFIKLGDEEAVVSRDDLAMVIINGHEETKKYEQEMADEAAALKRALS